MGSQSRLRIEKWSKKKPIRYSPTLVPLTWLSLSLAIHLGIPFFLFKTFLLITQLFFTPLIMLVFAISFVELFDLDHRATTHSDLVVRARNLGVDVEVVHNASVMNAIGICGLQLYRYGETVSIPFFTETWRPDSFYEKIQRNRALGLHTLCLLGELVCVPIFLY